MTENKLNKARKHTQLMLEVTEEEQPYFHLTGGVGWINDPNGFSLYKGEYHLFYQHHPYSLSWGDIHWGHAKTKDFITWERLPEAMAPDRHFDEKGCFSGSAVELEDGRHLLMYTGVYFEYPENGIPVEHQQQCIAFGDGINYEKYEGNPVIRTEDIPQGNHRSDFRDPKIWREGNKFYSVMGSRAADQSGEILLYESDDAVHWNYVTVLDACRNQYGAMWECPDFFGLDGKHVLLVSPQEMQPIGLEFHAGYNTAVLIGDYDKEQKKFTRESIRSIDYGIDFYAPQTVLTEDGRRVMIAWMQNWTTTSCRPAGLHFFGQMTLPRELTLKDGKLIQNPVHEIADYYGNRTVYEGVFINSEISLAQIHGRAIDLKVRIRPAGSHIYHAFSIKFAMNGEYYTMLRYKPGNNTIRIDRTRSGFPFDIVHTRDFLVRDSDGVIELRLVLDRYSMELFVNGGEQAASCMIYTEENASSIVFGCEGEAFMDVEQYELVFNS